MEITYSSPLCMLLNDCNSAVTRFLRQNDPAVAFSLSLFFLASPVLQLELNSCVMSPHIIWKKFTAHSAGRRQAFLEHSDDKVTSAWG